MSVSQFDLVVNQVKLLPPDDLVKLIKKAAELLEQKQVVVEKPPASYGAFFGAGKGGFATSEEVDRFIREERDAWEK